ncbi:MAG: hypothetical protein HY755_00550 [Nitrospirae bacterium]|nr:hypothetical protein [Nitrospirota bacterium]
MNNILLLYDTQEEDLARDFKYLLAEFAIRVTMIPLSSNKGKTLQDKEEHYFDFADGAIFIITPGSYRFGKTFPSPSVCDEMGQAKRKFKDKPEKIIYLVDKNCTLQAIDQKPYIPFDRNDIRSIVKAIILFIKDLKQAGCFGKSKIEQKETPIRDIAKYSESIDEKLKEICFDLSKQPNGFIAPTEFDNLLKAKYRMNQQDINFAKIDLTEKELAKYYQPNPPLFAGGWQLISMGWKLVRYEKEEQKKRQISNHLYGLYDPSALSELPALLTNYVISPKRMGLLDTLKRKNEP